METLLIKILQIAPITEPKTNPPAEINAVTSAIGNKTHS